MGRIRAPASDDTGVLVLSGYNPRAVLAFCRWAESRSVPYHVVARDESDPIVLTDYRNRVLTTRSRQRLDVKDLKRWTQAALATGSHQRLLLLPSTEALNRFALTHRQVLHSAKLSVPLTKEDLYLRLSDKESFSTTCRLLGLDIPEQGSVVPETTPFVAKPKQYRNAAGQALRPKLVLTQERRLRFLKEERCDDYFYQDFIHGRSVYLLAYLSRDGSTHVYSQENLIQQPDGGSIILARASDYHESPQASKIVTGLQSLGFVGPIMIEVRIEGESGRHVLIEANPRLWGPLQLIVDHQTGILDAFLEAEGVSFSQPSIRPRNSHYFWSGGMIGQSDLSFHNYDAAQFGSDLPQLLADDLYCRPDSIQAHLRDIGSSS